MKNTQKQRIYRNYKICFIIQVTVLIAGIIGFFVIWAAAENNGVTLTMRQSMAIMLPLCAVLALFTRIFDCCTIKKHKLQFELDELNTKTRKH